VQDASAKNEPATNAGHSETAAVFRVTNESPRPYPGEMGGAVEGPDGLTYNRVPNHCEGVYWWFDANWKPTADPFAPPAPSLDPHEMADEADTIAKCYFIGGDEGPIKIGYSIDVNARLRTIQLCSPVRPRVLAIARGGIFRESAYHALFDEHRLHGEWFERAPEIEAEIVRLNGGAK
jgi:hypothetical protein